MASFPTRADGSAIEPSYPVKKRSAPNTRVVRFADGFEQRIVFGLPKQQNPKVFEFIWKDLSEQDSDIIESFLDDRANDTTSFTYTPLNETSEMSFVCEKWDKTMTYPGRATINAEFREVFEP